MLKQALKKYLSELQQIINQGDYREESFYHCLKVLIDDYARLKQNPKCEVTILPKATEAGNPDFRVWDGQARITGYIEAKNPETFSLDPIAVSDQLKRYLETFPNLILTNFYEFRLYQHGLLVDSVALASSINATQMHTTPPITKVEQFDALLERYFSFSLPAISDPEELANALATRTRFLRDEIITHELGKEEKSGKKALLTYYEIFRTTLINNLSKEQFADLYAQTLTYGIFAARTRSNGEFNRELIYKHIPSTLGILKNIFHFISFKNPPQALAVLIDDIADILYNTDIRKILHSYYIEGRGSDPILHFYETFLGKYDPALKEKRGVYYTPEPVVRYIVKSIHSLLKSYFAKSDGLGSDGVTILDPAAGTLTFPVEAIRLAIEEKAQKYGEGVIHNLIKEHILPNFYAIELMMAPYTVGHLKISYLLAEHGYKMGEEERFKLYLSNTLEPDTPGQIFAPFAEEISEECLLANSVKFQEPILVIMGNPPYSGTSANINDWTEKMLKTDLDGAQSYYSIDGNHLNEKQSKWLQDDYVKFLRFAQWKIHKAGRGIVGMITNHGYLDNPTFRGMRQSLMHTFDEIYVLDLHGNSLKKEKAPDGSIDENVFDIKQGNSIVLMIKTGGRVKSAKVKKADKTAKVYHHELFGMRQSKYDWLENHELSLQDYHELSPCSPFYLFHPVTSGNEHYLNWINLPEIFPVNSVGIVTARDKLTIQDTPNLVRKTIHHFVSLEPEAARAAFKLGKDAQDWKVEYAQKDLKDSGLNDDKIVPILYRPFDTRYTYYTGKSSGFHCRTRSDVMRNMLKENVGVVIGRQGLAVGDNHPWNLVSISQNISDFNLFYRGGGLLASLYLYPDEHKEDFFVSSEREYNISQELLQGFRAKWPKFQPEQLFYYVYAVLHSNHYRQRFAQYLRMDFPRIPFTEDYGLFAKLADYGRELADLHLQKSPRLDPPAARYLGSGSNDTVQYVRYYKEKGIVQINPDKHFEGITPELWNFHVGGYQVLHKYLKDRKDTQLADPIHYCRIATSLARTIQFQDLIDDIIEPVLRV